MDPAHDCRLAEYVARMALGDQPALGLLYDAMAVAIFSLAGRIVRSDAAAEEITSDVFFQAWCNAASFDRSRGSVRAWLMTMCRSRAIDFVRARRPELAGVGVLEHDDAEAPAPSSEDPFDLLDALRRESAVRGCIARLEPVQRQLVALAFFRGYSHSEIADSTGLPLGTVKSHLRKALLRIRDDLETT